MHDTMTHHTATITPRPERCGLIGQGGDDEIRYRCRNAPPEVRQLIDKAREAAGRPTLWAIPARLQAARKRALAAIKRHGSFLERMRAKKPHDNAR